VNDLSRVATRRPGVELATSWSQIKLTNYYVRRFATEPQRKRSDATLVISDTLVADLLTYLLAYLLTKKSRPHEQQSAGRQASNLT